MAFVDLPGYGYANVPEAIRQGWRPLVESYLRRTAVLKGVVVLVDIRRGVQGEEQALLSWLVQKELRPVVALTKADKIPKSKRFPIVKKTRSLLSLHRDPLIVSTLQGIGLNELWKAILDCVWPRP